MEWQACWMISTVALLVLSDASFEWVLQTIWNILMNNHVHGTLKICCSFLEVSPEVIFVESDPWTCIAYKLGFSYVNDILWKIFFDSFLRSDWIQKKKTFGGEQYCLVFMSSSMVPWKDCWPKSRLSRKQKTELCERKVQQGSRDKDRLTSASECILNRAFLFVDYVKNKEFIITWMIECSSCLQLRLRSLTINSDFCLQKHDKHIMYYVLSILTVKYRLESGVCCCCCCCLSPVLFSLFFVQNIV